MSEKKLTPMQEHIEWLNKQIEAEALDLFRESFEKAKEHAKQLLEKEREVIEDAYNQGYRDGEIETPDQYTRDISEFNDANQYFNETFKNEE